MDVSISQNSNGKRYLVCRDHSNGIEEILIKRVSPSEEFVEVVKRSPEGHFNNPPSWRAVEDIEFIECLDE